MLFAVVIHDNGPNGDNQKRYRFGGKCTEVFAIVWQIPKRIQDQAYE